MASSAVKPEMRSSTSIWALLTVAMDSRSSSRAVSLFWMVSSFFSMFSVFLSMFSSFCWSLRSCFWSSMRCSLESRSKSLRAFRISSLASTSASRFLLSALLMASLMMRLASSSALAISFSAVRLRIWTPMGTPMTITPTKSATAPTNTVIQIGNMGIRYTSLSSIFIIFHKTACAKGPGLSIPHKNWKSKKPLSKMLYLIYFSAGMPLCQGNS
ncbi:hypothetical protein KL86CLO1_10172 [uncultured Eubacteriales bacterium]|uniref:Uncharacterized protein n=1 Tax=uncultured Eubacteriales bacterium TaxID=172733 RepID=A0A212IX88_9FIRM|nr:hypothetical protein KL86CLO1_10172 [uncultured Eubacteriales bacterium]